MPSRWMRWFAFTVFVISSTLNYLDRQLLAFLAPLIIADLHTDQTHFGWLITVFSIAYAASSLFAGWFLDRAGVNVGISVAVSWWSLAAMGAGWVRGLGGLGVCRAALGVGESAGVPAVGKVNGVYLEPEEHALGAAANQIGLSLGAIIAPLWIGVAKARNWRTPFVITGFLGFIWIPIWLATSRLIPPRTVTQKLPAKSDFGILADPTLVLLVIANVLWMSGYSIWSNWTTLYLIHVHHVGLETSANYSRIPPLVSNLGGFFGGWLSARWAVRSAGAVTARCKAVWVSVAGSLLTLFLPLAPDARWATALISVSFFFALAGSVNIYALPIDIYGASRSGLSIAALTCAFGILQAIISPIIGYLGDHQLYKQVVWIVTVPLILSAFVLEMVRKSADLSQNVQTFDTNLSAI